MISLDLQSFDFCALIIAGVGAFIFSKSDINAKFICIYLLFANLIHIFNLREIGGYYYLIESIVDLVFIKIMISSRASTLVLKVLLSSIFYKSLSLIEYNTSYTLIYSNYELVMALIISILTVTTFSFGVTTDGTGRSYTEPSDDPSDRGYSRLSSGETH